MPRAVANTLLLAARPASTIARPRPRELPVTNHTCAIEKRTDKLSVLRNPEGFVLTLMYDRRMTPEQGYPGMFHVGFLQPTQHAVDLVHDDLSIRNYMAPKPAKLQRGGPPTYGFYYDAPGGVTVEVSTMNMAEPA